MQEWYDFEREAINQLRQHFRSIIVQVLEWPSFGLPVAWSVEERGGRSANTVRLAGPWPPEFRIAQSARGRQAVPFRVVHGADKDLRQSAPRLREAAIKLRGLQ